MKEFVDRRSEVEKHKESTIPEETKKTTYPTQTTFGDKGIVYQKQL